MRLIVGERRFSAGIWLQAPRGSGGSVFVDRRVDLNTCCKLLDQGKTLCKLTLFCEEKNRISRALLTMDASYFVCVFRVTNNSANKRQ